MNFLKKKIERRYVEGVSFERFDFIVVFFVVRGVEGFCLFRFGVYYFVVVDYFGFGLFVFF